MKTIAPAVLAALALAGPAMAAAQTKPTASRTQPSSYAPGPHSGPHVYGSPIGPPIVGKARPSHHPRAVPKHPTAAAHDTRSPATKRHQPAPVRGPA